MERVDHAHLASLDDIRGDLRSNKINRLRDGWLSHHALIINRRAEAERLTKYV